MNNYFYRKLKKIYDFAEDFFPKSMENLCVNCNICCTAMASLGVSLLELEYINEYLLQKNISVEYINKFIDYINKAEDREEHLIYDICPFYDKGCFIYPARPLSCRTYGYFIKEEYLNIIPEECFLKKDIIIYNDETFAETLPFVLPFYSLVNEYLSEKVNSE